MWSDAEYRKVFERIDSLERQMVEMQRSLTAIPALSPTSGGDGEEKKAAALLEMVKALSPDEIEVIKAPDDRVPCGYRPSIAAKWLGRNRGKAVWIMTHTDIVPPGARDLWHTDPYEVVEKDGRLYGRGVEDNQQSLVASFFAVQAVRDCGLAPPLSVGLLFAADEETGSEHGAHYVVNKHPKKIVLPGDILLVPDGGLPDGSKIEIAEKSILWLKCKVTGKQAHGSRPDSGRNAHRAGARLLLALDATFHQAYTAVDPLFEPPESTFEPTKKDANVENINTIPGEDVFYFDCRILPGPSIDDVLALARATGAVIEQSAGVKVAFEVVQGAQAAPPTPVDSEVVARLKAAIKATRGIEARTMGIGGGTVAAIFREAGIPAAVWETVDETAHQPNESCSIANMIADAKVFAHVFGQG